jgi:hypothetical protein
VDHRRADRRGRCPPAPGGHPVDAYDAIGEATGYVRLGNWTNYGSDTGFPYREVGLTTWAELAEAEEASA